MSSHIQNGNTNTTFSHHVITVIVIQVGDNIYVYNINMYSFQTVLQKRESKYTLLFNLLNFSSTG